MASKTISPLSSKLLALSAGGLTATLVSMSSAQAQSQPAEIGIWYNHTGKGAVQVYRCMQDAKRLCGRIVWLKKTTNDSGEPLTDGRNPKAAMRSRPICGLPVLGNLQRASNGSWKGGWVYDPEKGAAYTASIQAKSAERLAMTGYKGIFYKTHIWKRAPADLPRCGDLEPVAASAG